MTAKAIDSTGQNDFWHYAVGSDRKGPVPRPTLAKLLASGEISAETYVWQPGMDNWVHLGDAAPLKALVAGIEGDAAPEDFVEEDTAFTSPEELRASHTQLDKDEDGALREDTIVEPLAGGYTIPMGSKPKPVEAAAPMTAAAPVAAKPVEVKAAAPAPKPAKADDDDIFGSAVAATSSSVGSDLFTSAVTSTTGQSSSSDIFASGSPAAEDENIAGVHGRRQSSVLFSLDELGREDGKKGGGPTANDAFVTDSSGLIDIKAVATSHKQPVPGEDPFGGSGVGLVMPPRAATPGAMSIPIVGRKRSMGPWILAAVALLVGGGVALALILTGNKDQPVANNPVVAGNPPGTTQPVPKEDPTAADPKATPDPKIAAADPKAGATDPAAEKKPDPAVDAAGNPVANAGDPAVKADPTANPATAETKPEPAPAAGTIQIGDKKPEVKKPEPKPTEVKKTDEPKKPEVVVAADPPKPPKTTENTQKVNSLLDKLSDKPTDKTTTTTSSDTSLPDKLSAAVVRNTIKGKFGSCGSMVTSGGPVSVMTSFVIAGSGVVQSARVTDAAGVGSDVQRCVVGVIKGTTFGKFKEATMTVNLPVKLL